MKAKQSFLELLQTLATYAAIVTPILAPVLAFSGFNLDDRLLTAFVVVFLLALVYLASQYRKAKQSIEAEGIVQRPQWLWRLLTNRITHIPKQLNTGTIMVIVPPSMREQYAALKDIHNQNNQINLLSHYLPAPSSEGKIDEDCAESKLNERRRPVSDLDLMLEDCEGITLLDDGSWQRYKLMYPRTWKVINDWSNKHTVRPVMAIRVEGEGTLKYSWCNLDETIVNNQALLSKMLSLTTDRGSSWFNQATSQRRLVLILSGTLVAMLVLSLFINLRLKNRIGQLEDDNSKFSKLMVSTPWQQTSLAERFAAFRHSTRAKVDQKDAEQLLRGVVYQLKNKITECSNGSAEVVMFALRRNPTDPDEFYLVEAAATRPLRKFDFRFSRREKESESMISCAVAHRSFVYWEGIDQSGMDTKDIQLWDLSGKPFGKFVGAGRWEYNNESCKYTVPNKLPDDPHQYMLCGPVGISNNSSELPAGAMCFFAVTDLKFNESWARQLFINYGNLLSFFYWEQALPETTTVEQ